MAGETPGRPRGRLASALAHPAALIALTAVLTGLLVPWITNRWEARDKAVAAQQAEAEKKLEQQRAAAEKELDRQRKAHAEELAVKSAIVGRMATSTATFLSAIEVGAIDRSRPVKADQEYSKMKKAAVEIASQLAAYFPAPSLSSLKCQSSRCGSLVAIRWNDLSFGLRNTYLLLTSKPGKPRNLWLNQLNRFLDQGPRQYAALCRKSGSAFEQERRALVLKLQQREQELVNAVMLSPSLLTGKPTHDRNRHHQNWTKGQKPSCH